MGIACGAQSCWESQESALSTDRWVQRHHLWCLNTYTHVSVLPLLVYLFHSVIQVLRKIKLYKVHIFKHLKSYTTKKNHRNNKVNKNGNKNGTNFFFFFSLYFLDQTPLRAHSCWGISPGVLRGLHGAPDGSWVCCRGVS